MSSAHKYVQTAQTLSSYCLSEDRLFAYTTSSPTTLNAPDAPNYNYSLMKSLLKHIIIASNE